MMKTEKQVAPHRYMIGWFRFYAGSGRSFFRCDGLEPKESLCVLKELRKTTEPQTGILGIDPRHLIGVPASDDTLCLWVGQMDNEGTLWVSSSTEQGWSDPTGEIWPLVIRTLELNTAENDRTVPRAVRLWMWFKRNIGFPTPFAPSKKNVKKVIARLSSRAKGEAINRSARTRV
jgi:hypothetical protein